MCFMKKAIGKASLKDILKEAKDKHDYDIANDKKKKEKRKSKKNKK